MKYCMANCRLRKTFITFCNYTKFKVTFVHIKANTLLLILLCNHNYRQDEGLKKIRPQDKSSFQRHSERFGSVQVIIWAGARKTFTAGRLLDHTEAETPRRASQVSLIAAYMETSGNTLTDYIHTARGFVHFLMKRSKYVVIYVILNCCYSGQTTQLGPRRCSHYLNLSFLGSQRFRGFSNLRICSMARERNLLLFVMWVCPKERSMKTVVLYLLYSLFLILKQLTDVMLITQ